MTNSIIQRASLVSDMRKVGRGELSLNQLIDRFEARFKSIEPTIEAFLSEASRFDRLRRDAESLAEQYSDPASRPPLYGALLGVKDIFHVDGFTTRAGSRLPPSLFAGAEANVVTRLKKAGALVIGKTVTTEFAYFEPGPTRNPHNPAHTPGGSSSGSAAAIAAGLAHLAIGTQTVGSVIRPAAYCGIIGYKPSFGRVDTAGLVYFSPSADHVGFFTGDIADMQRVCSAVIDNWSMGPTSEYKPALALPVGAYLEQSTALDYLDTQLDALEAAGYDIERVPLFDDIAAVDACHQDLIAAELALQHKLWFAQYSERYRPRTAALIRRGQSVSPQRLQSARDHQLELRNRLHSVMDAEGIDLWVCPSAPDVAPRGIDATGSPALNMPWTHAGLPAVSLPAGRGKLGLPLGLQLVGRYGKDEELLRWANGIESEFKD